MTDTEVKNGFISNDSLNLLLNTIKSKMNIDLSLCENQKQRNETSKEYRQKLFVKLSVAFKKQGLLDGTDLIRYFSTYNNYLLERIEMYYNMIEFINDELNIDFYPDRLFTCAFFRMDAETYNKILVDPSVEISQELKRQIKGIEEFILSMTTNGLEQGSLKGFAWKRMQLKAEYGGNEVKSVESNNFKNNVISITTSEDVNKRLESSYQFPELANLSEEDKK